MKRLELAGKTIGHLTVIDYSHSHVQPSGQKRAMWDVVCSCGTKKKMSTGTLKAGGTVSCGHIGKENRKKSTWRPDGESAFNSLFSCYKHSARIRGYNFSLTRDVFREMTAKDCVYCGSPPNTVHRGKFRTGYKYNGIDRVDNSKGYNIDNIAPCCAVCNKMKMAMSVNDFIGHIQKVIKHASIKTG